MKNKLLSFAIVLSMLFSLAIAPVRAEIVYSGTCGDNLTWTLDDSGTLRISGNGDMKNYTSGTNSPWYSSIVSSVIIEDGVTSIGNCAFFGCSNLAFIKISDNVTSIGADAFRGCGTLAKIVIPDKVRSIGSGAFYACSALTRVVIGRGVISIGDQAFRQTAIKTILIPDNVISIGGYAFYGCSSLNSATIGIGITNIGSYAFMGCKALKTVIIPDSVTIIRDKAFCECSSLTDVYYGGNEEDWEWITICGGNDPLTNSTIHYKDITNLYGTAKVIEDNIVIQIHLSEPVIGNSLHMAIYSEDNTVLDYIIVPRFGEFREINVVFKDIPEAEYAKVFLWNSLSSLEPIAGAKRVNIIRD